MFCVNCLLRTDREPDYQPQEAVTVYLGKALCKEHLRLEWGATQELLSEIRGSA